MDIRIALAGNPNSGKTTLFNALTGSNQFVGNWPGVTVEKKEGNWQAAVASITGLVAKENIVGTMGILYGAEGNVYETLHSVFTGISAYSFLVFNLLCAPCFAAIGAIKREMNSAKWTWFAIGYQCGFAYIISLMINQFGNLFTGNANVFGVIVAVALLAGMIYLLVRPYKEATKLTEKVKVSK